MMQGMSHAIGDTGTASMLAGAYRGTQREETFHHNLHSTRQWRCEPCWG